MRTFGALFTSFALLATAPAQTSAQPKADPFRFVPADAQLVVRFGAPARWQQHFAGTKVAKLLASEAFAPWVAQLDKGFDEGLEHARKEGKLDVDVVQRFLKEYRGEVVFAGHLDVDTFRAAAEKEEAPKFWLAISLVPDASFDLASLAATISKGIEDEQGSHLRDVTIGEHRLRGMEPEGVTITVPAMIDGHLVMLIGNDLDKSGGRLLVAADRMAAAGGDAPLWASADFRTLMPVFAGVIADKASEQGAPFDVKQLLRDIGLLAFETMSTSIRANGDRTEVEFGVGVAAKDRGLFDVLPADPAAAKMLRWLPAGVEAYSVTPFDLGALVGVVRRVWDGMGDEVPMKYDDAMAAFTEATKVRLKEDLIDHLGTGFMQLQDVVDGMDVEKIQARAENDPIGAVINACYVVALRDGKAFGESLEKMLRSRGMHASRKTEEYEGTKIHRLRLAAMIDLEYAVTDDMLLLAAGGEAPRQYLRGVLDAKRQGGSEELPAKVAGHVGALPKGWHGLSVAPVASILTGIGSALTTLERFGEIDEPEIGEAVKVFTSLGREFERHGLGTMVSTTYVEARRISGRLLW